MTTFDSTMELVDEVEGWLHPTQARRLWEEASAVDPPATIVEIGSYRGRSTILLARAAPQGVDVVAIDPHAGNDRGPNQWHGTEQEGQSDNDVFNANLERAGVRERVRHVRRRSQEALGDVDGDVRVLWIDGAHGYRPALSDLQQWGERVEAGGTMLVHDAYLSVGVTLALLREMLLSRRYRYLGRERSMVIYRREPVRGSQRITNALRQLTPLGWFARNITYRLLRMAGLQSVSRVLGDPGGGLC